MQHTLCLDKMSNLSWDDQGEEYDLKSVMHYDGDAFITTEAWLKGESTMTYKGRVKRKRTPTFRKNIEHEYRVGHQV